MANQLNFPETLYSVTFYFPCNKNRRITLKEEETNYQKQKYRMLNRVCEWWDVLHNFDSLPTLPTFGFHQPLLQNIASPSCSQSVAFLRSGSDSVSVMSCVFLCISWKTTINQIKISLRVMYTCNVHVRTPIHLRSSFHIKSKADNNFVVFILQYKTCYTTT